MPKRLVSALPYVLLAAILGLAAYMRLHQIGLYMTFLGDEGRDVLVVKRMIVDGKWTLLGPTASVGGFFMGPAYYYFMAPFLWLWHLDPVGPAIGVALVGIATVFLVFLLGRMLYNTRTGLVAALLYALSPVVIAYSRSSWNPNIVPFFSTLLIILLWDMRRGAVPWKYALLGVVLGIGLQLHYVFLFLFAVVGLWMLLQDRVRRDWRSWAGVMGGFLVGFSPFLMFELRHGFTNIKAIASFLTAGKETGFTPTAFLPTVGNVYQRFFSRLLLRIPDDRLMALLPAGQRTAWIDASVAAAAAAAAFLLVPLGAGIRRLGWRTVVFGRRDDTVDRAILLVLWAGIVLFCFGLYRKSIYDYYFGIVFAFPFIVSAGLLERVTGRVAKGLLYAAVALGLAVFLWGGRPFQYQPNDQLGQARRIAQAVVDRTGGKPYNFALVAPFNSDHAYRYFFEIWGKPPVTIENAVLDPTRKTVTGQLLIVCEDTTCQPLGNSLWEIAGFGRAEIAGVWDVSVVKIYRLVHYQEGQGK
jgi:4-amino-4-deoxy-L-arabinose transferase-like glycosyltransferase